VAHHTPSGDADGGSAAEQMSAGRGGLSAEEVDQLREMFLQVFDDQRRALTEAYEVIRALLSLPGAQSDGKPGGLTGTFVSRPYGHRNGNDDQDPAQDEERTRES
jgi:hypothetical protein